MKIKNYVDKLKTALGIAKEAATAGEESASAPSHQAKRGGPEFASESGSPREPRSPVRPEIRGFEPLIDRDLMLAFIGETGKSFYKFAEGRGWLATSPAPREGDTGADQKYVQRHDVVAMMLGYKLVTVSFRLKTEDGQSLDLMRSLRASMVGMLLQAIKITVGKTGAPASDMREEADRQMKIAEDEITKVIELMRSGSTHAFLPLYENLARAFGGEGGPDELEARFGAILAQIFAKISHAISTRSV